jgi:hypothetical protein
MGYNTTLLVLNDALSAIENDPEFGRKLANAIRRRGQDFRSKRIDMSVGSFSNAVSVIDTVHSGSTSLIAVGGNYASVITKRPGYEHHTKESQQALLAVALDIITNGEDRG